MNGRSAQYGTHANIRFAAAALVTLMSGGIAAAQEIPGVTSTEVKVGGVFPYSGPASAIGLVGRAVAAYVQSINDRGGINGRKINYISYDDAYQPPKAVEHVRKLVESDEVAFIFSQLGTPGNTASAKYLLGKKVPSIAPVSGSSKFTKVADFPYSTTALVSFDTEGKIYAKYLTKALPGKKYAILYQNDDLGKDYVNAFKSYLGKDFDMRVVTAAYELSDPTVDSQVVTLKSSGAEALLVAGTPKFAAQAIRKAAEIGWKGIILINYPSASLAATIRPAGMENSIGVTAGTLLKDPTDAQWDNDPGMQTFRAFMAKYMPGSDIAEANYEYGYQQGAILEQILKQCGNDLSRENIIKQAKSIKDFSAPTTLPGLAVNTSDSVNMVWTQMRLQRWNGTTWELFGDVLDAKSD